MATYEDRLNTFYQWPDSRPVSKEDLAMYGFEYIGPADRVWCRVCNLKVYNWVPWDTALGEHRRWRPQCPFLVLVDNEEHRFVSSPQACAMKMLGYEKDDIVSAYRELSRAGHEDISTDLLLDHFYQKENPPPPPDPEPMEKKEDVEETVRRMNEENERMRRERVCVTCEGEANCLLLPCAHIPCCRACAWSADTYPKCGEKVLSHYEVFRA
jgi:hypothetical protein